MLRKKIVRLAKMFNGKFSKELEITANSPEYITLDTLLNDRQADLALAAGLRQVRNAKTLADRSGFRKLECENLARELSDIGIFSTWLENGERKYYMDALMPVTFMNILTNKNIAIKYPQISKAFDDYVEQLGKHFHNNSFGTGAVRVIAVEDSIIVEEDQEDGEGSKVKQLNIDNELQEAMGGLNEALYDNEDVSRYDRISYYIQKNDKFCLSDCACAVARSAVAEGDGFIGEEMCLHLGRDAEYYIETGRGRQITKEEALEFIKKTSADGAIHAIINTYSKGENLTICSTKYSTCLGFKNSLSTELYKPISSNFIANADPQNCIGCKECVSLCPSNAIKMTFKNSRVENHENHKEKEDYRLKFIYCDEHGSSPCIASCPLHLPVQGILNLVKDGRMEEAYKLILKENPFPMLTSNACVCRAESDCLRSRIDETIAIKEIENYLAEGFKDNDKIDLPVEKKYNDKIAIIGSGPSGMSCAYYLAKKGYRPTIFEKNRVPGGALSTYIPSFRLKRSFVEKEIYKLERLGVEIKCNVNVGVDITIDDLKKEGYKSFFVGIGCDKGLYNEANLAEIKGVYKALDYLRDFNLGKEEPLTGNTIVIGCNSTSLSVARAIIRSTGGSVQIFTHIPEEYIDLEIGEILNAQSEGVKINTDWIMSDVLSTNGRISAVTFDKVVSLYNSDGEYEPTFDLEETKTIECKNLVYADNFESDWNGLDKQLGIEIDIDDKVALVDTESYETSVKGVFAGGDALIGLGTIPEAIGSGKIAAESIHRFLRKGQSYYLGRHINDFVPMSKNDINYQQLKYSKASKIHSLYKSKRVNDRDFYFNKVSLTEQQAQTEAERCINCGTIKYDKKKCIGCGQCASKCPTVAIWMEKRANKDFFSSGYKTVEQALIKSNSKKIQRKINK